MPELLLIAAGRGTRMGELTRDVPKAMLAVERGRSILELTLANLAGAPSAPTACVIGGHGWPRLEAFCGRPDLPVPVRAVLNPDYNTAGPARSILAGLATIDVGQQLLVVGNGDTVFSPSLLAQAVAAPVGITLFASRSDNVQSDELLVSVDPAGRVASAAKALSLCPASHGLVSAGLVTLNGVFARAQFRHALQTVAAREAADGRLRPWHSAFEVLANDGTPAAIAAVERCDWVEFDTLNCIARHSATPLRRAAAG